MNKTLAQKKQELERLQREVEEQESRQKYEEEKANAVACGCYIPLATAIVKYNLYNKGERDFEEIGDSGWYTASQLLGSPHFKKGTKVVLLKIHEDFTGWYSYKEDGEYYEIDGDQVGLEDSADVREDYLSNVEEVKII